MTQISPQLAKYLPLLQKLCLTAFVFCAATLALFSYQFTDGPTKPDPGTGKVVPFNGVGASVYYITDAENRIFRMAYYGSTVSIMLMIFVAVVRQKTLPPKK